MGLADSLSGLFSGKGGKPSKNKKEQSGRGYNSAELALLRNAMDVRKDVNQASYNLITVLAQATPNPEHPEELQNHAQIIIDAIKAIHERAAEVLVDAMQGGIENAAKLSSRSFNVVASEIKDSSYPLLGEWRETALSIAKGLTIDGLQLHRIIGLYEENARWLVIKDGDTHYKRALEVKEILDKKTSKALMEMVMGMASGPAEPKVA